MKNKVLALLIAFLASGETPGFSQQQKITASDATNGDNFSYSIGMSDSFAAIGAPYDDQYGSNSGSIYVFGRDANGWTQKAKLYASDPESQANFGASVALVGNYMIVGAPGKTVNSQPQAGAAYIYFYNGTQWVFQAKLVSDAPVAVGNFGISVSLAGTRAFIGSHFDLVSGVARGRAYVFNRSGTNWSLATKLAASDGTNGDEFGKALAATDSVLVVAASSDSDQLANAGSAYVFRLGPSGWTQTQKLVASDAVAEDFFGFAIGLADSSLAISAIYADPQGQSRAGAVYLYGEQGSTWTFRQKVAAPDARPQAFFGKSIALSDSVMLVGAFGDSEKGTNAGAAYLFYREGAAWTFQKKLLANDTSTDDQLGWACAARGTSLLVGAVSEAQFGTGAGAAYFFQETFSREPSFESASLSPGNDTLRVAFSEPVFGDALASQAIALDDLELVLHTNGGTLASLSASALLGASATVLPGERVFRLALASGDTASGGEFILLRPAAAGRIFDRAGQAMPAAASTDTLWLRDRMPPRYSLSVAEVSPHDPTMVRLRFSEPITGLQTSDFFLTNGSVQYLAVVEEGLAWDVAVKPASHSQVSLTLMANSVTDAAGNHNDQQITVFFDFDPTVPQVLLNTEEPNPTTNASFSVTISFSEAVSGFELSDLQLTNATASSLVALEANQWTFTLTAQNYGLVEASLPANSATDGTGLGNAASNVLRITYDQVTHLPIATLEARLELRGGWLLLDLPTAARLTVMDLSGRVVAMENRPAGEGTLALDQLPSGGYLLLLEGAGWRQARKLALAW